METAQLIDEFFSKAYENDINNRMLEYSYNLPKQDIIEYVKELCHTPYRPFIDYAVQHRSYEQIRADDITQSSSFEAYTTDICKYLLQDGDKGYNFEQIGELIQNDGVERSSQANKKYGENQAKTAAQLGLVYVYYKVWYLTCLGYVYNDLPEEIQMALLARTILRNKLYQRIIADAITAPVDIIVYMSDLTATTQERRCGSVLALVDICKEECLACQYELHEITSSISKKKKQKTYNNKTEAIAPVIIGPTEIPLPKPLSFAAEDMEIVIDGERFVMRKYVDWSLLSHGLTIPQQYHTSMLSPSEPGAKKEIIVSIAGEDNIAHLIRTPNGKVVQLLYGENDYISIYLRKIFSNTYKSFQEKRANAEGRINCKSINEYVDIYHNEITNKYIFKCTKRYTVEETFDVPVLPFLNSRLSKESYPVELQEYFDSLTGMNRNQRHGQFAPHKPVLLLSVLSLIEQGVIKENVICPHTRLEKEFERQWNQLPDEITSEFTCTLATPFWHMQNEPFWYLHNVEEDQRNTPSIAYLRQNMIWASLDEGLFDLCISGHREDIEELIKSFYFRKD